MDTLVITNQHYFNLKYVLENVMEMSSLQFTADMLNYEIAQFYETESAIGGSKT